MTDNQMMVLDRWGEDAEFRSWMRADAAAAVASLGITLTDEDLKELEAVDWTLEDEELERQFLKSFRFGC